jgi:hypothetical protein
MEKPPVYVLWDIFIVALSRRIIHKRNFFAADAGRKYVKNILKYFKNTDI